KPTTEATQAVSQQMAELYKMVPLTYENDTLTVAMSQPNLQAIDDLRNFVGIQNIEIVLAQADQIETAIVNAYAGEQESITTLIQQLEADTALGTMARETSIDITSLEEMAEAAPVRKLINMVLLMAIRDHASDIHFEPFEDEYKMRYRCDGVLLEMIP